MHHAHGEPLAQAAPRRRRLAARLLLAITLCGSMLTFLRAPAPVAAAAGWNHFIDPGCTSSSDGVATPGINWFDQAPTTYVYYATVYLDFYDSSVGNYIQRDYYDWGVYPAAGSTGDLRHYLQGNVGPGSFYGRVNYSASYHSDDYREYFSC